MNKRTRTIEIDTKDNIEEILPKFPNPKEVCDAITDWYPAMNQNEIEIMDEEMGRHEFSIPQEVEDVLADCYPDMTEFKIEIETIDNWRQELIAKFCQSILQEILDKIPFLSKTERHATRSKSGCRVLLPMKL